MKGIKDKVIFITGANSGLGYATAIEFAKAGAKIAFVARRESESKETLDALLKIGAEAIYIKADVACEDDIKNAIAKTVDTFGTIDFAFNNSGVNLGFSPLHEISEQDWDTVLDINLKGMWLSMKHEIPVMLKAGKGVIVNMSSMGGLVGNPVVPAHYIASKHAVIGITKQAALEYAKFNIRVNAISPAVIETPMVATLPEEAVEPLRLAHPMQRLGKPEEVANAVLWLCSEGAGFVTGHTLTIDGGYFAQ